MREKYGCSAVLNEQHLLTWMLKTTPLLYNFCWLPVKVLADASALSGRPPTEVGTTS
jgi:hypothetical protein